MNSITPHGPIMNILSIINNKYIIRRYPILFKKYLNNIMVYALFVTILLLLAILYIILIHTVKGIRHLVGLKNESSDDNRIDLKNESTGNNRIGIKFKSANSNIQQIGEEFNDLVDFVTTNGCQELRKQKDKLKTIIDKLPLIKNNVKCSDYLSMVEKQIQKQSNALDNQFVSKSNTDFVTNKFFSILKLFTELACKNDKFDKDLIKSLIDDITDAFCF